MCGICGEFLWRDGQQADPMRINKMLTQLVKRGPDAKDFWVQEQVGFGHTRLAIIDLTPAGQQPMRDQELTLVFNGCIYNYKALRAELIILGHEFQSDSDTEVILKAYRQWGSECLNYLDGMFAFAIWDDHQQQLFLARDRFGIKPLYYALTDEGLRFASNTQALLASGGINLDIDPIGLHFQLTLHGVIPAPHTILKGIKKLQPGHYMLVQPDGQIFVRQYWQLNAQRPDASDLSQPQTEQAWLDATHDALKKAVAKRVAAADVPVGVLLSGGLDSSLLVGLLAEAGMDRIQTFSIGFEDIADEQGSEFEFSDKVVARYNTQHHKYVVPNSDVLPRLPEAVAAMSEPMVGQDAVAFYLLSEQVSQDVKVVLSGQGADEVFGGYFWYPQMAASTGSTIARFAPYYFDRSHEEWLQTVDARFHLDDVTSAYVSERLTEPGADEFLDQVLRFDATTLIVDDPVKRVDNMTMAWGLEARVPFLDKDLVELAMQAPPELKLGDDGKTLLKRIARGLVPDEVIDRPKGYFPMPALKFVRGEFYQFMRDILMSPAAQARGLFNPDYVARLLANPEASENFTAIKGSKLWHCALLELWLQTHVDPYRSAD
ncbi:N-acetylglutaminylglutamine amidotransferase [Thiomicrospira cyclica]|uniref:asparagine synthase (glutamine-hydrolyzing) n=1 Tax=Thiomicrospira cyclica (strain DSM 14477 / JCM 11371 / ALM1) TaxID=717773 RepID=F6D9M9_THICA|nr:N-acetylglutaminylglutamine amidotransferase [Thiomicrospira cyclica]AEG30986.1 asparagine synthase family amidotransferase [Thiomicrospira cyclica ALM1]